MHADRQAVVERRFTREVNFGIAQNGIVTAILACGFAGGQLARGMAKISYSGYRFPPEIIQQAIWLYLRFTLSLRDVEDLLAERGIMVSYETVLSNRVQPRPPFRVQFRPRLGKGISLSA